MPTGFCSQKLWRLIFLALEPWAGGPTVGLGPLTLEIPLLNFYLPYVGEEQPVPTSLDVCGFFNSVVVRLPFNFISDGSEGWLFYSLVVVSLWLCREVSHVCLCRHLDWRSMPISYELT